MKTTVIVTSAVFFYLVYCDVRQATYSLECPDRSHWKIKADSRCNGNADRYYHCLYNPNKEMIKEFCAIPKDYTTGFMAVFRGNIDADTCPGYRYMPFNFKSNLTKNCIFLKSKCNGEGQLVHHNWSLAEDVACTCDFSNGYSFVQRPKNNCFCVPSHEDCSCYKKQCGDSNYILSPDYGCIVTKLVKTQSSDSHKFKCHTYQNRIQAGTNARIISVSHCLSDVSSNHIKNVPCNDRSCTVKIFIVIAITLASSFFIIVIIGSPECLNEDEGKKQIDASTDTCQSFEEHQENTIEIPKKPVDNNINEHLNEEEVTEQIDTSNDTSQALEEHEANTIELPKKPVSNNLNADDYFIIKCKHSILQLYDGVKLRNGFKRKPRILDMCFINLHNEIQLVYIDADNKMIVVRDISNVSELKKKTFDHVPNRLAKIDNSTVAIIYKKELHILIFDVDKMNRITSYSISPSDIINSQMYVHGKSESRIQGILALSPTKFILSDKSRLFSCKLGEKNEKPLVSEFAPSLDPFDTARRLTHVTVSQGSFQEVIFIADENDKILTSISHNEDHISNHTEPNRGLQNVRAIGATEHRVYAATSAGISVFCHNEGVFTKFENQDKEIADYRMILEYEKHVEHTRGLCLHLDEQYIYIGLSCVIKQNDVILIFKFKPDDNYN